MATYYTDLPFMAHPRCSYCMDLPFNFMVDSIYLSAVRGQLQFFRSMQLHLTLLAVMLHMMDSLNFHLKSLHKQTVAETVQKFLLLFYLS